MGCETNIALTVDWTNMVDGELAFNDFPGKPGKIVGVSKCMVSLDM